MVTTPYFQSSVFNGVYSEFPQRVEELAGALVGRLWLSVCVQVVYILYLPFLPTLHLARILRPAWRLESLHSSLPASYPSLLIRTPTCLTLTMASVLYLQSSRHLH